MAVSLKILAKAFWNLGKTTKKSTLGCAYLSLTVSDTSLDPKLYILYLPLQFILAETQKFKEFDSSFIFKVYLWAEETSFKDMNSTLTDWLTLCLRAYQQELPYVLLSVWLSALNLGLAVVVEGAWLQRCLQLPGALQELCFRGDLAHKHLSGDGLGALRWRQLGILKRYQLSTKLEDKEDTRNVNSNKNILVSSVSLQLMIIKYFSYSKGSPHWSAHPLRGLFEWGNDGVLSCGMRNLQGRKHLPCAKRVHWIKRWWNLGRIKYTPCEIIINDYVHQSFIALCALVNLIE